MAQRGRLHIGVVSTFLFVFAIYLFTMQPSLSLGDGGELSCASYFLGCAHPPGFPLFASMSHLVSLLPFGEVSFRGNLFAALFGALTAALVFVWLYGAHGGVLAALGALAVAFAPVFWEQSTRIRTYPLLAFVVIAVALLWRSALQRERWELYVLSVFVLGLGLGAHQLLVGMVPAAVVVAWAFRERWKSLWQPAVALLLGVLVFLHLMLRSHAGFCWGAPKGFGGFLSVLLQKQYQAKMATFDMATWLEMLGYEFVSFAKQYAGLWLLAPLGFLLSLLRQRLLTVALGIAWLSMLVVRSGYIGSGEFEQVTRYLLGCYAIFGIFCIEGLAWLLGRLGGSRRAITLVVSIALAALVIYRGLPLNSQVPNRVAQQWSWALLYGRPYGSVLLVGGDNDIFPIWYQQRVSSYRSDVVSMGRYGFWSGWLVGELRSRLGLDGPTYQRWLRLGAEAVKGGESGRVRFFGFLRLVPHLKPSFIVFNYTEQRDEEAWKFLNSELWFAPHHYGFEIVSSPDVLSAAYIPPDPVWPLVSLRAEFARTVHVEEVAQSAAELLGILGEAQEGVMSFDQSIGIFEAACEIDSHNPDLFAKLAHLEMKRGNLERAQALLEELHKRGVESSGSWLVLGRVYERMGMYAEADRCRKRAMTLRK